jgi:hypothetical protein
MNVADPLTRRRRNNPTTLAHERNNRLNFIGDDVALAEVLGRSRRQ